MLTSLSWTASLGQASQDPVYINPDTGDTMICYNIDLLRQIAERVTYANECDTLLKLSEDHIHTLDSLISIQDYILHNKTQAINTQNIMIAEKNTYIFNLSEQIKKDSRKTKFLKFGWLTTSVILGTMLILK
jgi:hypothetical protein